MITHRPLPKDPRSPDPIKITQLRVQYTNPFILLLFKILWVEKGDHPTCCQRHCIHIYVYITSIVYTYMCI